MKSFRLVLLILLALAPRAFATVTVTSPVAGTSVTSPVHYVATATAPTCSKGVASMGIYVNNKLVYHVEGNTLNTELTIAKGAEHTVVEEWDKCGTASYTTINLTIVAALKPTVTITANPTSIKTEGSTVLTVSAANSTKVTVTGSDSKTYAFAVTGGTDSVSPTSTTTYTATATGPGGTATAKVTVTVSANPAPTVGITASPASIAAGSSSTLKVTAANATKVTIAGNNSTSYTLAAAGGTQVVSPASTTIYTVTATGAGGTATAKVTVTVTANPSPTVTISASPGSITAGGSSTLTVTATNATTVTIAGNNSTSYTLKASGGTQAVSPGSTTIYTATATGAGGTVTAKATVTVTSTPTPTVTITANPGSIIAGGSSTLTVTATNATQVTIAGNNSTSYTLQASGGTQAVSPGSTTIYTATATGAGGATATAQATVTVGSKALVSIAVSPNPGSFVLGNTQQFTATATYNDTSTADVTATANWSMANTAVATIDSSGLATSQASGSTTVTASLSGVSGNAPLTVTIASGSGVNVPTWHFDNYRSGLNANEQSLSTLNVSSQNFGKLFSYSVNGYAYAQPLLVSGVTINGAVHNVLYVATETNDVYAFDADNPGAGGGQLWHVTGATPDNVGSSSAIYPTIGITGTPAIDTTTNTMYFVSKQSSGGTAFWLNALDITSGAQKFGGPVKINASIPTTETSEFPSGYQTLTTSCIQRTALLEAYGNVYFGFGSCHSGWMLAYDTQTLQQTGIFNTSPNMDGEGQWASAGGVWMGGGGPASNGDGNVYVTTGNGPWDGQTAFSDSILQFVPPTLSSSSPTIMQPNNWFTPQDYQYMDCSDGDLASGGLLLIPGSTKALAGAKTAWMYLVDTTNLGSPTLNPSAPVPPNDGTMALQTLQFEPDLSAPYSKTCSDSTESFGTLSHTIEGSHYEVYGTSAYFNHSVYLGVTAEASNIPAGVRQFTLSGHTLTPSTYTGFATDQQIRGTTPFISANGTSGGVLWIIDQNEPLGASGYSPGIAILRAFDPNDLSSELYDSGMNPGDAPGYGIKFTSPIVANGKVYIATGTTLESASKQTGEIDVYGLN